MASRARAAARRSGGARFSPRRACRGRTPRVRAPRRHTPATRLLQVVGGYTRRVSRQCKRERTRTTLAPASIARSTLAATSPVGRTTAVAALLTRGRRRPSGPLRFHLRIGHPPTESLASPTLLDGTTTEPLRVSLLRTTSNEAESRHNVRTSPRPMGRHKSSRLKRKPTLETLSLATILTLFTPWNLWIYVSLYAVMLEHDAYDVLYDCT